MVIAELLSSAKGGKRGAARQYQQVPERKMRGAPVPSPPPGVEGRRDGAETNL
jgi:hypothetical protein